MGTTTNYAWDYPDDGGDADTWGAIHTTMVQAIDASLKSVSDTLTTAAANAAPTGAVMAFLIAPSAGWVKLNGATIGNASSGATGRANADTAALFAAMWGAFNNSILPIQNSSGSATTRGANAAADFAANKRLPLLDFRGRFIRGLDDGLGLDPDSSRAVGSYQTHDFKAHTHQLGSNDSGTNDAGGSNQEFIRSYGFGNGPAATSSEVGGAETRPVNVAAYYYIKL